VLQLIHRHSVTLELEQKINEYTIEAKNLNLTQQRGANGIQLVPFDNLISFRDYFIEGNQATVVMENLQVPCYLEEPVQYLHEDGVITRFQEILSKVKFEQWASDVIADSYGSDGAFSETNGGSPSTAASAGASEIECITIT
jgi:hypothetical protein